MCPQWGVKSGAEGRHPQGDMWRPVVAVGAVRLSGPWG